MASWEKVTLQNRSQETVRARGSARKPACYVNKLRFSQNEKHFSRTGSRSNGASLEQKYTPLGQDASMPLVMPWPRSVFTVVEQARADNQNNDAKE
ncbi:MAG: hypothetical protein DMF03_04400 [Verrucomicrobia bacterium]|nr:MAG: hypothetical protein DMF03_04400 [Verrucomicrobiota bacterium]